MVDPWLNVFRTRRRNPRGEQKRGETPSQAEHTSTSSTCSSQVVTLCPREASLALCCVRKTATFPAATPEGPSSFHCSISKYYSLPLLFASPFSLILPIFLLSYATTVYRRSKWTTIDSSETLNPFPYFGESDSRRRFGPNGNIASLTRDQILGPNMNTKLAIFMGQFGPKSSSRV